MPLPVCVIPPRIGAAATARFRQSGQVAAVQDHVHLVLPARPKQISDVHVDIAPGVIESTRYHSTLYQVLWSETP
jgi:hypothetical protein